MKLRQRSICIVVNTISCLRERVVSVWHTFNFFKSLSQKIARRSNLNVYGFSTGSVRCSSVYRPYCFSSVYLICYYYSVTHVKSPRQVTRLSSMYLLMNGYVYAQNCLIWDEANSYEVYKMAIHPQKDTVWC